MGISRVSTTYMVGSGLYNIQNNLLAMSKLQQQLASGKNISTPSDDPIGMTKILRLNLDSSQDDQFKKNIQEGVSELDTTDSALKGLNDIVNRARELATQGANGTNSTAQLTAIKKEIESLIDQAVQLGNTSVAGRYIFSGYITNEAPFAITDEDVEYTGSPADEEFERDLQVGKELFVPLNLNGDEVLGNVTVTGGIPDGEGLIYTLTKLKIDLENADYDEVRNNIDLLKTDQNTILTFQSEIGARTNQLTHMLERIEDRGLIQSKQMADIQDVDIPKAVSDLNFQQNMYQASLSVMSRILQSTSLLNFLN